MTCRSRQRSVIRVLSFLPETKCLFVGLTQHNQNNEEKNRIKTRNGEQKVPNDQHKDTYLNLKLHSSLQHVAGTVYHTEGLSKCGGEVLCCRERLPLLARHQQSKTMCRMIKNCFITLTLCVWHHYEAQQPLEGPGFYWRASCSSKVSSIKQIRGLCIRLAVQQAPGMPRRTHETSSLSLS